MYTYINEQEKAYVNIYFKEIKYSLNKLMLIIINSG